MSRDRYVLGPRRLLLLAGSEVDVAIRSWSVAQARCSLQTIFACCSARELHWPSLLSLFFNLFMPRPRSRNGSTSTSPKSFVFRHLGFRLQNHAKSNRGRDMVFHKVSIQADYKRRRVEDHDELRRDDFRQQLP